ncbi:MAG TPA: hypothetical protein VFW62_09030, partial [bacterium]|nr:hypothetical protein [bacterium]
MTPGGAPSDVGGPVTIGNSLDGGGSDVAGGGGLGGDLPTGGAGGGQAGPSTQQSNDNIGGGCVRSFHVKLKVLHNGSEEACTVATTLMLYGGGDVTANSGGGVYAPVDEDADGPPKVTVSPAGALANTQSLSCVEGRWQTTDAFFFRAVCSAGHDVTASATWRHKGQTYLSNIYSGAPTKEPGDYTPIP